MESGYDCSQFLLVINEPVQPIVGNGIIVLADISQHPQQPLTFHSAGFTEGTLLARLKQCNDRPAMFFNGLVRQVAFGQPVQLGLQVKRHVASAQSISQVP